MGRYGCLPAIAQTHSGHGQHTLLLHRNRCRCKGLQCTNAVLALGVQDAINSDLHDRQAQPYIYCSFLWLISVNFEQIPPSVLQWMPVRVEQCICMCSGSTCLSSAHFMRFSHHSSPSKKDNAHLAGTKPHSPPKSQKKVKLQPTDSPSQGAQPCDLLAHYSINLLCLCSPVQPKCRGQARRRQRRGRV